MSAPLVSWRERCVYNHVDPKTGKWPKELTDAEAKELCCTRCTGAPLRDCDCICFECHQLCKSHEAPAFDHEPLVIALASAGIVKWATVPAGPGARIHPQK